MKTRMSITASPEETEMNNCFIFANDIRTGRTLIFILIFEQENLKNLMNLLHMIMFYFKTLVVTPWFLTVSLNFGKAEFFPLEQMADMFDVICTLNLCETIFRPRQWEALKSTFRSSFYIEHLQLGIWNSFLVNNFKFEDFIHFVEMFRTDAAGNVSSIVDEDKVSDSETRKIKTSQSCSPF